MANWYGYGRFGAGVAQGMMEGQREQRQIEKEEAAESRAQAEETRRQKRETRAARQFERTEKFARTAEARRNAEEQRAKIMHELNMRKEELNMDNARLDQILKMGAVADDEQKRRIQMRLAEMKIELAEIEAAGKGLEPPEGAGRMSVRAFKKYVADQKRKAQDEGVQRALPHLFSGTPDSLPTAERILNSQGSLRMREGSLRPTADPNDEAWMFEYVDEDTGQLKRFNAMSNAQILGGIVVPIQVGDREIMTPLYDKEKQQWFEDQEAMARTEFMYGGVPGTGRGRGRSRLNDVQTAELYVQKGLAETEQEALKMIKGKDRTARATVLAKEIMAASQDWEDKPTISMQEAMRQATQIVDQTMFGEGQEPQSAGVQPGMQDQGGGRIGQSVEQWGDEGTPAPGGGVSPGARQIQTDQDLIEFMGGP